MRVSAALPRQMCGRCGGRCAAGKRRSAHAGARGVEVWWQLPGLDTGLSRGPFLHNTHDVMRGQGIVEVMNLAEEPAEAAIRANHEILVVLPG